MQQSLALARTAKEIAGLAVALDLPHVAADCLPAADLPLVLGRHPAAEIIAAVPLEPAARIVRVQPALVAPHRERLARIDVEEIERAFASAGRQLRAPEPRGG